jgi:hypothetical protein
MAISRKQKEARSQSAKTKTQEADVEEFEEVKIGRESSHSKERTYSLKNSSVIKRPWL